MSSDINAERVLRVIYAALEKTLKPEALDRFIKKAYHARGSMSVHGVAKELQALHHDIQRKRKVHATQVSTPGNSESPPVGE